MSERIVTAAEVERLREAERKATPGEWGTQSDGVQYLDPNVNLGWLTPHELVRGYEGEMDMADCELIALSRNALPALLATVEAAMDLANDCSHWANEPMRSKAKALLAAYRADAS